MPAAISAVLVKDIVISPLWGLPSLGGTVDAQGTPD
jgi:hypothetical protein